MPLQPLTAPVASDQPSLSRQVFGLSCRCVAIPIFGLHSHVPRLCFHRTRFRGFAKLHLLYSEGEQKKSSASAGSHRTAYPAPQSWAIVSRVSRSRPKSQYAVGVTIAQTEPASR